MGEPQTHTHTHAETTLNVEVPAYKYAAPKKNFNKSIVSKYYKINVGANIL